MMQVVRFFLLFLIISLN
jgi:hypothetical protein